MKILRCIHSLNPVIGGPLESVKQLSRVLAHRGHEVEVVSLDAPTDPWLREFPTTVHALGPGQGNYGYSARLVPWLKEQHAQYDAVVGKWLANGRKLPKVVRPDALPTEITVVELVDQYREVLAMPHNQAKRAARRPGPGAQR